MLGRLAIVCLLAGCVLSYPAPHHNPEEAGKFEGDMDGVFSDVDVRAAINRKWPNGLVHYQISGSFSKNDQKLIADSLSQIEKQTCIRFAKRTSQRAYVTVEKQQGCFSSVGRTGKAQVLSLGQGCMQKGIIMHEFMHAIGFHHEHSRPDRDRYVTINWQYIKQKELMNFHKYEDDDVVLQGISYDYGSLMHYEQTAFSINPSLYKTIIPKQSGVQIGQRKGLSSKDVQRIKKWYGCK